MVPPKYSLSQELRKLALTDYLPHINLRKLRTTAELVLMAAALARCGPPMAIEDQSPKNPWGVVQDTPTATGPTEAPQAVTTPSPTEAPRDPSKIYFNDIIKTDPKNLFIQSQERNGLQNQWELIVTGTMSKAPVITAPRVGCIVSEFRQPTQKVDNPGVTVVLECPNPTGELLSIEIANITPGEKNNTRSTTRKRTIHWHNGSSKRSESYTRCSR
jgi:hypothetical protein